MYSLNTFNHRTLSKSPKIQGSFSYIKKWLPGLGSHRKRSVDPSPLFEAFFDKKMAPGTGQGLCYAKPFRPPRSKYRNQASDIYSLRRPVEPLVLAQSKQQLIKI